MRQGNSSQLRVLHLVSTKGVAGALQQSLFMPLLIKAPKQHLVTEVVCLAPGAVTAAVLRQNGVPVHELPLSSQRFSFAALSQLVEIAREFKPEIIHAWGYGAHILAVWLRKRCKPARVLLTASGTVPAAPQAGFLQHQKVKAAARAAAKVDRVVYSSEAAAAAHRRFGFPEQGYTVIAPGVDPLRFKPDPAARRRVREQFHVPANAFVIGMMAPCQAEYDHPTFLKGIGELVKTQPNIHVLLAGHGVQKGNASLMAQLTGNLSTRIQLLGEWSDHAGFFNACDVAVSSALTDAARLNLVMAMLCAVPCVATGVGEQGEAIGQCSVAIEPGSPAAIVRGISRVIEMPAERRTFLAHSSRKHALKNFVQLRALQLYVQLYGELLGRSQNIEELLPSPLEAELPASAPPKIAAPAASKIEPLQAADSLETQVKEVIDWQPPVPATKAAPAVVAEEAPVSDGDVLAIFESARLPALTEPVIQVAAARQSVDEVEDLLAPELLAANAGEEFRPRHTLAAAAKTKSLASSAAGAADSVASTLQPLRVGGANVGTARAVTVPRTASADSSGEPRSALLKVNAPGSQDLDATLPLNALNPGPVISQADKS